MSQIQHGPTFLPSLPILGKAADPSAGERLGQVRGSQDSRARPCTPASYALSLWLPSCESSHSGGCVDAQPAVTDTDCDLSQTPRSCAVSPLPSAPAPHPCRVTWPLCHSAVLPLNLPLLSGLEACFPSRFYAVDLPR